MVEKKPKCYNLDGSIICSDCESKVIWACHICTKKDGCSIICCLPLKLPKTPTK